MRNRPVLCVENYGTAMVVTILVVEHTDVYYSHYKINNTVLSLLIVNTAAMVALSTEHSANDGA